jgi:hypothetical protein
MPILLDAIANNQLKGIPFMKSDVIRKYLVASPSTSIELIGKGVAPL